MLGTGGGQGTTMPIAGGLRAKTLGTFATMRRSANCQAGSNKL